MATIISLRIIIILLFTLNNFRDKYKDKENIIEIYIANIILILIGAEVIAFILITKLIAFPLASFLENILDKIEKYLINFLK
ncbi:hypothetical protein [Fusobacterium polymorphum]|uniref:hypothetical protein n=1 Tax=Fusobacterium nucleatum subsp. polymorphum TaxID=76857 RepID=UPI0030D0161F